MCRLTFWAWVVSFNTLFYSSTYSPAKFTFLYSCYFVEYYNSNIGLFPGTICLEYFFSPFHPEVISFFHGERVSWRLLFFDPIYKSMSFEELRALIFTMITKGYVLIPVILLIFLVFVSSFSYVAYYYSSKNYSFLWYHHGWIYCFLLKDSFSYNLQS